MTKKHKCASCIHCEMCRWIDEVHQDGCDFYAESAESYEDGISQQNNLSGLSSNATLGDIVLAFFPDFMKNTLLISNEEDFKKFAELGKNLVRLEDWNTPCKGGEK